MRRLTDDERAMFAEFIDEFDFCFACGWVYGHSRMDASLEGKWCNWLERHHIAKCGRVHARWNIVSLCKLCHDLAEGLQHRDANGNRLPNLSAANILWLKRIHDPTHYNRAELAKVWRGMVPRIAKPPRWFALQTCRKYRRRWPGHPPYSISSLHD